MREKLLFIFIISSFLSGSININAQNIHGVQTINDTMVYKERYGVRLGIDLSRPGRSITDKRYTGFEISGDYRLKEHLYPAVELGHEDFDYEENYFTANSQGSYIKLGANYNVYPNWIGMQNEIYVGLRYGFSTFTEKLKDYSIYNQDPYFPTDFRDESRKFSGLNGQWLEFQLGLKVEVLHNVFLGLHAEAKRLVTDKSPSGFDNLWIPGFNRVYHDSKFGIGWGYTISYLLPIYTKERREALD